MFSLDRMTARLLVVIFTATTSWIAASEKGDICDAPPELVKQFGMTYRDAVREARAHREHGLAVLFRMSTSPQLDGAWAECYATDMGSLLRSWGDRAFAVVLRKQPSNVRKAEWRVLRDIALMDFSERYPKAFAAGYP